MDEDLYRPSAWDLPNPPAFTAASVPAPDPVEPSLNPRLRAAYRLGYLSFGIWFWHEVDWMMDEWH